MKLDLHPPVRPAGLPPALALLRPHHWVKNGFVAVPLFLTPSALSGPVLWTVLAGMLAFCGLASAIYVLNDWRDRQSDRAHPVKCRRPLAAGTVPEAAALVMMGALGGGGMALAWNLDARFGAMAALYVAINLAYNFGLRHVAIADVMLLAIGFVVRVEAGAALIHVTPSAWIVIMTGLLALFLALAKRRDDIVRNLGSEHRGSLNGYSRQFLDMAVAVVLGALLVAYLVYATDEAVMLRLGTRNVFYTTPFVVAGILRYLQIAVVEEKSGSPTLVLLTDRFLMITVAGWGLTFGALIYG